MRFKINYRVGNNIREDVIEADTLEEAVLKASQLRPNWQDVEYSDKTKAVAA